MLVRFYIAPQIGTGTDADPFRSMLNGLIDITQGDWFDEIDNPARRISICCVHASQATHDIINLNADVVPIGDAVEEGQLGTVMDSLISSLSNVVDLKNKLETNGISTSWYSSNNTIRDGLRYLMKLFFVSQINYGEGQETINYSVRELLRTPLTTTVAQVSQSVRNDVKTWMQNKGLAIGWITNTTTVKEILHFIITNLGIGKIRMSLQEF